jgi:flagellar biosynthetic protein FlhB
VGLPEQERRTLPPTPRRREEARRQGLVPRSPDTGPALGVVSLALVALVAAGAGARVAQGLAQALSQAPAWAQVPLTPQRVRDWVVLLGEGVGAPMWPALVLPWALAAAGLVGLQGVTLSWPRGGLARIHPGQGLARLFSWASVYQLLLGLAKVALVGAAGAWALWPLVQGWAQEPLASLPDSLATFGMGLHRLTAVLAAGALGVGSVSAAWARMRYEQQLRMTPEEMKEEMRRFEGDPRRRSAQRRAHRRLLVRLRQAVQRADVVVTNPEHVAVALWYQPQRHGAPEVVAKGRERMALRIREIARESGVPVVENPPLARALYRDVEVGQEIPPALFTAVAEVLAYVYRRRGFLPGPMGRGER